MFTLKVADRKLNPIKRKYSTPQELLMMSIREKSAKSGLRKVSAPPSPKLSLRKFFSWNGKKRKCIDKTSIFCAIVCNNVRIPTW